MGIATGSLGGFYLKIVSLLYQGNKLFLYIMCTILQLYGRPYSTKHITGTFYFIEIMAVTVFNGVINK